MNQVNWGWHAEQQCVGQRAPSIPIGIVASRAFTGVTTFTVGALHANSCVARSGQTFVDISANSSADSVQISISRIARALVSSAGVRAGSVAAAVDRVESALVSVFAGAFSAFGVQGGFSKLS